MRLTHSGPGVWAKRKGGVVREGIMRAEVARGTVGLIPDSHRALCPSRTICRSTEGHTGNYRSGLPFLTQASIPHSLFLSFLQVTFQNEQTAVLTELAYAFSLEITCRFID